MQLATDAVAVLQHREPLAVLTRPDDLQRQGGVLGEAGRQGGVQGVVVLGPLAAPRQGERAVHLLVGPQGHQHGRTEARPAEDPRDVEGPRVGRDVVDGDRGPGLHHDAGERMVQRQRLHRVGVRLRARCRPQLEGGPVLAGHDPGHVGAGNLAGPVRDRLQGVGSRVAGRQEGGDLRRRREPALPPRPLVVQAGVLDRDARRGGERDDDLLVAGREVASTRLLGEVEVAEDAVADPDRHPEERRHRRVVVGEAVGRGVLVDVVQPQRFRVVDEQSQHAVPARQVTDLVDQALGHAVVDEGAQPAVGGLGEHPECGVPRVDQLAGDRHDPLQHTVEAQPRGDRDHGVQQQPQPLLATGFLPMLAHNASAGQASAAPRDSAARCAWSRRSRPGCGWSARAWRTSRTRSSSRSSRRGTGARRSGGWSAPRR